MPSGELLAAAAEMTQALRWWDAELEADDDLLIGLHWRPPTVVAEAASANEAERFEEVRMSRARKRMPSFCLLVTVARHSTCSEGLCICQTTRCILQTSLLKSD